MNMTNRKFSNWIKWNDRNNLSGLKFPGVYFIAISDNDLSDRAFDFIQEIKYVGMTNAISGLKGRLNQFNRTIIGKSGHGGADRFRYKHSNYNELVQHLYVSVHPFECDVTTNSPDDLRIMGEVAKFEYECFARYSTAFNQLPEFNDKQRSKKDSQRKK